MKTISNIVESYRVVTAAWRPLPNFLVIGGQRCGTTSLHDLLCKHPNIRSANTKEVHYFDGGLDWDIDKYSLGENWYRAQFPIVRNKKVFESSPLYLFDEKVPQRIASTVPDVKLIVLLRNPIDRAISHYNHEVRLGHEKLPLLPALKFEEERLTDNSQNAERIHFTRIHFSYKSRGLYYDQIERYLSFFPRKSLLIIKSEELFSDPVRSMALIFNFLGLNSVTIKYGDLRKLNASKVIYSVPSDVLDYLAKYYYKGNLKLEELLRERCWS